VSASADANGGGSVNCLGPVPSSTRVSCRLRIAGRRHGFRSSLPLSSRLPFGVRSRGREIGCLPRRVSVRARPIREVERGRARLRASRRGTSRLRRRVSRGSERSGVEPWLSRKGRRSAYRIINRYQLHTNLIVVGRPRCRWIIGHYNEAPAIAVEAVSGLDTSNPWAPASRGLPRGTERLWSRRDSRLM
jgi:hypothetical protein